MGQEIKLKSNEIRAIRLNKNTILDLTWNILKPVILKAFQLTHNDFLSNHICIDWFFREESCEIIIIAHSNSTAINEEVFRNTKLVEALDSFLNYPKKKIMYHSMLKPPFIMPNHLNKNNYCDFFAHIWKKLPTFFSRNYRPLKKNECRVICLSKQAIVELLWEYFMANGDSVMSIPEKDSCNVIFHMSIKGSLEKLILYAVNLNEFSIIDWDEVDNRSEQWDSLKNDWELVTLLTKDKKTGDDTLS